MVRLSLMVIRVFLSLLFLTHCHSQSNHLLVALTSHGTQSDLFHTLVSHCPPSLSSLFTLSIRSNPSISPSSTLTDFILLSPHDPSTIPSILSQLSSLPIVRYAIEDKPLSIRAVLSAHEDHQAHERGLEGESIVKTPSRGAGAGGGGRDEVVDGRKGRVSVAEELEAMQLWERNFTGRGVKVAVFDTGIHEGHPHFRNVRERLDWTNEKTFVDNLGHGTFVTGVIASQAECRGFVPDADLYIFRVFNTKQNSFTSWFLDAFNYAITIGINVLNLSIGGPDYLDRPFVEKVNEMTANGIIVISAIGNDGPVYGTLNNPADQMDVIGVGGIDRDGNIAPFSSRGMTTWELPRGYGRVKPDIVTFGKEVLGSKTGGGCKQMSGTSFASPVVAGAVALLASIIPEERRWSVLNPGSMKQALVTSATRLPNANIFEQGMGRMNLLRAAEFISNYQPHASAIPAALDLTDCPYMWPYCAQSLYADAQPVIFNLTIMNGMSLTGKFLSAPVFVPDSKTKDILRIDFEYSETLYPWAGYLAVLIRVARNVDFEIVAGGRIEITVVSERGEHSLVNIPLRVSVIPTPPRDRRILWDQFRSLRYPTAYLPRDNLDVKNDILDWNGDHPHTNFKDLFTRLRSRDYYIEVSGSDLSCTDLSKYGVLMIVDPEEEFFADELTKIHKAVLGSKLSLLIVADWYNVPTMKKVQFHDENMGRLFVPITGGANVPALNDLLGQFGIMLSDTVYKGKLELGHESAHFASGTSILRFPQGGMVHAQELSAFDGDSHLHKTDAVVLGIIDLSSTSVEVPLPTAGRIAVYGDSTCLDSISKQPLCSWLLDALVDFVAMGDLNHPFDLLAPLTQPLLVQHDSPVERMEGNELALVSQVISKDAFPQCAPLLSPNSPQVPAPLKPEPIPIPDSLPDNAPSSEHQQHSLPQASPVPRPLLALIGGLGFTALLIFLLLGRSRSSEPSITTV